MKNSGRSTLFLLVCSLAAAAFGSSCAKVPKEAVTLSTLVGERIAAVQTSHEKFVRAYFDLARQRVEDFLETRWIPEFLATFVRDADLTTQLENATSLSQDEIDRLREALKKVVSSTELEPSVKAAQSALGDSERGQITLEFAQAAVEQIEKQRSELMQPLNQLEATALAELRGSYAELIQMQSTVTAFVTSVRKVQVEQDEILRRLNLLKARDNVVAKAIQLNDQIVSATEGTETATEIIKKIKEISSKAAMSGTAETDPGAH